MKYRQIQLVLDQVMNGVLERAWLELLLVVDHHHAVLAVVVGLEAWHATLLVGSAQILANQRFFYSLNAWHTCRFGAATRRKSGHRAATG